MGGYVLRAYDANNGAYRYTFPSGEASWSDSINESGSMSVNLEMSRELMALKPRDTLTPWDTIIAVMLETVTGWRVVHAGIITGRKWDAESRTLGLSLGGFRELLKRRLNLNHDLDSAWRDGFVTIDEENPEPVWKLVFDGTLPDMAVLLLRETMKWAHLQVKLPTLQGGKSNHREYNCWSGDTVDELLKNLTELQNGIELRFDPTLTDNVFWWNMRVANEIVDATHTFNTTGMSPNAILKSVDESSDDRCDNAYAFAGKQENRLLVARFSKASSTGRLLQSADTSHTSVSVLETLQSFLKETVENGTTGVESVELKVPRSMVVMVGDHANVIFSDAYYSTDRLLSERMKVTDVKGSTGDDWQTIELREMRG